MERNDKLKLALKIGSVALIALGIITAIPFPGSKEASVIGYKSVCPFNPFSTIILLYSGYIAHAYHSKLKAKEI